MFDWFVKYVQFHLAIEISTVTLAIGFSPVFLKPDCDLVGTASHGFGAFHICAAGFHIDLVW